MNQLNKETYDISLVCLNKNGPLLDLIHEDISIIELTVSKTLFSFYKLSKTINEIKPDIIFSSIFRGHIALYISLCFSNYKPKVILRSPNSPKLLIERNEISFIMKKMLEYTYKKADKIIAQTPEMKEEIVKYHYINPNKIEVFLNPIDKELIDKKLSNISNPFNPENINVVACGRLTKQKGFDTLIKAFKKVTDKNHNFRLHIIGDDLGDKKKLLELTNDLNLDNIISFIGFQSNPYKYYFYSNLYVLSSRWEGLPNTVLENLYLRKAIISTKCIPFMEQLLADKENALLVDVENVEQLSNAILNYKKITPIPYNSENDVNNIFKEYTNV